MDDILGHGLRHDDSQVRVRHPLIAFQFGEPGIRPGFGPFRFPKYLAAELTGLIADVLEHIAAELAFGDRLNQGERELSAQLMFERDLQRFTLRLLGTLFRLALQAVDLSEELRDLAL
jgi:hypothetical protein